MKIYITFLTLTFLFISPVFANEMLYSEKVLLSDTHDPRDITFLYEDGKKLSGVHLGVEFQTLWELDPLARNHWFNAMYSKEQGLVLKHMSKPIEFSLVGQVTNHPIDRLLRECYGTVGGSSMGIQRCLIEHHKLLDIEISRSYKLLEDNGEDIEGLQKSWETFSDEQYSYIGQFYSKFSGTRWLYISMEDVVEISSNHLNTLNGWLEVSYGYED
jgi:hypothetical protein